MAVFSHLWKFGMGLGKHGHESKRSLLGRCGRGKKEGEGRIRQSNGINMIKVLYMCVWKYHNESPYTVQLIYTNNKNVS
jgi:hypothetical protein